MLSLPGVPLPCLEEANKESPGLGRSRSVTGPATPTAASIKAIINQRGSLQLPTQSLTAGRIARP